MSCSNCFTDWICKCVPYNDVITINTNVPAGMYEYKITDKFDNIYQGIADRNVSGGLDIPVADFPDGFWSEHGGVKEIKIYEYGGCNPISFPIAMQTDCLIVETKGGNSEKNTIGCDLFDAAIGIGAMIIGSTFIVS